METETDMRQQVQIRCRDLYRNWKEAWGGTITHHRRQAWETPWWDRLAEFCLRRAIEPALMLYVGYAYANANPEETEVPFGPSIFRSQTVLNRSLATFREVLITSQKQLESVSLLCRGRARTPHHSTDKLVRDVAEDALVFFRQTFELKLLKAKHAMPPGHEVPAETVEALACRIAGDNPFMLAAIARSERYRVMAAVNIARILSDQPWNAKVWEGLVLEGPLSSPDTALPDAAIRDYYENGELCTASPASIGTDGRFTKLVGDPASPRLYLIESWFSPETELFLRMKLDQAKLGGPG